MFLLFKFSNLFLIFIFLSSKRWLDLIRLLLHLLTQLFLFFSPVIHERLIDKHHFTELWIDSNKHLIWIVFLRLFFLVWQQFFYFENENVAIRASCNYILVVNRHFNNRSTPWRLMNKYLLKKCWRHVFRMFFGHFNHLNSTQIVYKNHVVYLVMNRLDKAQIINF